MVSACTSKKSAFFFFLKKQHGFIFYLHSKQLEISNKLANAHVYLMPLIFYAIVWRFLCIFNNFLI